MRRERCGAANVQNIRNADHEAHDSGEDEENHVNPGAAQHGELGEQDAAFKKPDKRQQQTEPPNCVII